MICGLAPTDLSIKKDSPSHSTSSSAAAAAAAAACCGESAAVVVGSMTQPVSETRLDAAEVSAIRQLIAGYRESAAFLSRSADELQQLILHQN